MAFDQTPPGTADGLSEAVFDWVDSVPYYFPIYRDDDVYIYRVWMPRNRRRNTR